MMHRYLSQLIIGIGCLKHGKYNICGLALSTIAMLIGWVNRGLHLKLDTVSPSSSQHRVPIRYITSVVAKACTQLISHNIVKDG